MLLKHSSGFKAERARLGLRGAHPAGGQKEAAAISPAFESADLQPQLLLAPRKTQELLHEKPFSL